MFKLATIREELVITLPLLDTENLFRQAITLIGKLIPGVKRDVFTSEISGKLTYGLQKIPITVYMSKFSEEETVVTVTATSDDWKGIGAKEAIKNLFEMADRLRWNEPEQMREILERDQFKHSLGLSRKKFITRFLILVAVGVAASVLVNFVFKF